MQTGRTVSPPTHSASPAAKTLHAQTARISHERHSQKPPLAARVSLLALIGEVSRSKIR